MPRGITQCYLPPGRGDIPALTPAEAGTRLSDPGGIQGSRRNEVDRQFIGRSIDIVVCVVCSFVKCHLKLRIDITLCGADCRVHVTVGCPGVRQSVRLSLPSIDVCHLLQPGRGQQISVDSCGRPRCGCGLRHVESRGARLDADLFGLQLYQISTDFDGVFTVGFKPEWRRM